MMVYGRFNHRIVRQGFGGSGKAFVLPFVLAWILFWSPNLVDCGESTNFDRENEGSNDALSYSQGSANETLSNETQPLVFQSRTEMDDNSQKTMDQTRLDAGASSFLAGPSLHESIAYSNHACTCHPKKKLSYAQSSSDADDIILPSCTGNNGIDPCMGRVFYLVGIHDDRTLNDALYLFRAIRDSKNIIMIHIDTKFGLEPYNNSTLQKEIEACPCGSHVEVASVHNCEWGSWSMNLPTLWSMEKAVKEFSGKWDVFINLSGDSLPVYSQDRISKLFGGPLRGMNFVTSVVCETGLLPTSILDFPKSWHKRKHYSHRPPVDLEYVDDNGVLHHDVKLHIYFGSQWVSLTPQFCDFIVGQLSRPDSLPSRFRDWLIDTQKLMADETFFTSMVMRFFPNTVPNVTEESFLDTSKTSDPELSIYTIRYERMDEHVPTAKGFFPVEQRYQVPITTGIAKPKPWGPYFLGVYDLDNIRTSGALYIRKVATAIDGNMYTILPVDTPEQIPAISWPREVRISPVPDWEKTLAELRKKAAEKQK